MRPTMFKTSLFLKLPGVFIGCLQTKLQSCIKTSLFHFCFGLFKNQDLLGWLRNLSEFFIHISKNKVVDPIPIFILPFEIFSLDFFVQNYSNGIWQIRCFFLGLFSFAICFAVTVSRASVRLTFVLHFWRFLTTSDYIHSHTCWMLSHELSTLFNKLWVLNDMVVASASKSYLKI